MPAAAINYPAPDQPMSEHQQRELIAAYYACNSFVDAQVGVLIDAIDSLSLWDSTVIVFVSDHGYHLGDHGGFWHKLSLFEASARVPLIVYAPGMKAAGKSTKQLVELIDLYPTLVALSGLPAREHLDGINFGPVLDDPAKATKSAAITLVARSDRAEANHARHMSYLGRSLRTERWRYTEWDDGRRGIELYDHQKDPRELVNLAAQASMASIRDNLRETLSAYRGGHPTR